MLLFPSSIFTSTSLPSSTLYVVESFLILILLLVTLFVFPLVVEVLLDDEEPEII